MRPGIAAILLHLFIFFTLLAPVQAVTYLDSLAARQLKRPSRPTRPAPGPVSAPRQAAADLSNLYTCQNVAIDASLEDTTCESKDTSSGGGLLGGVGDLVTQLVCTTVVRKLNILVSDCVCVSAGDVTPVTRQRWDDYIRDPANNATDSVIFQLTSYRNGKVAYTAESLLTYLVQAIPPTLTATTNCRYPTGAYPTCGDGCTYECPARTRLCGNTCLADERACISNTPQRRSLRDTKHSDLDLRCPRGKMACALPQSAHGGSVYISDRIECIDIRSDIESCGGCAFPLPGRQSGIDCTAIPHAGQVSCVAGACLVHTCQPGYSLNGTSCMATLRRRSSWKVGSGLPMGMDEASVLYGEVLDAEVSPEVNVHLAPSAPPQHVDTKLQPEDEKARKAAGKKTLAKRQLTTKQLLERRAKRVQRKSRWAAVLD